MRYDHFTMLPEQAFRPRCGRKGMTLEAGVIAALSLGAIMAGYSIYAGQQANAQQKKQMAMQQQAQDAQLAQQKAQMKLAEEATNKANQKAPDTGILDKEKMAASQGVGETMLTGQLGIPQEKLSLAKKTTLLGS
jgi:uncharacterized protein HemX